jgi:hypothetical protein
MPVRAYCVFFCLAFINACQGSNLPAAPSKETSVTKTAETLAASKDERSQFDFAKEWATISKITDDDERIKRGLALASQWKGHVYSWYGFFMPGLCFPERESCFAQIFDRKKTESPDSLGGFLPELRFTKEAYGTLRAGCQAKEACVVYFEGLLSEVHTDPNAPLAFTFTNVSVEKTREVSPEEQWWKEPLTLPAGVTKRKLPADINDQAKPIDLSALTKKEF